MLRLLTACFCIVLLRMPLVAQYASFRFKSYDQSDGISQSMVKKIRQDGKGFIWLATEDGLNRFDGKNFKVYKKGPLPKGLPWNDIQAMMVDSVSNTLWLGTDKKGICTFDLVTEEFSSLARNGDALNETVNAFCQTSLYVWCATDKGVQVIDKISRKVVRELEKVRAFEKVITITPSIVYALTTDGYLFILEEQSLRSLQSFTPSRLFPDQPAVNIANAFFDGQQTLWISTRKGLYRAAIHKDRLMGIQREKIETIEGRDLSANVAYCIYTDSKKALWLGIDSVGLLYRPAQARQFQLFRRTPANPFSIADNYFWDIYEDKSGTLWVGTDKGVSRVMPRPSFLTTIGQELDEAQNRLYRVFAICPLNDEEFIFGRRSNAYVYNRRTNGFTPVENRTGVEYNRTHFIKPFGEGLYAVGTKPGFFFIEKNDGRFIIRKPAEYPELHVLAKKNLTAFEKIDNDNYLLGGHSGAGLFWWNRREGVVHNFRRDDKDPLSLAGNDITSIHPAGDGRYWITTESGLSLFNPSTARFANYFSSAQSGGTHYINDLVRDGDYLWLVFYQEGLVRWHTKTGKAELFSYPHGAPTNSIYNLRRDARGQLWLSTNAGISRFDPNTLRFTNYTVQDGLQDNEFIRFSASESEDEIYFGGIGGVSIINKRGTADPPGKPAIAITGFHYIEANQYRPYEAMWQHPVRLRHSQNDFSVQFASLDFATNHRVQYTYKLEGHDRAWIKAGPANSVSYTNLAPGRYTFRVKLDSPDGTRASVTSLPIYIVPAWYQTLFFRITVSIALALMLFFMMRGYYLARLRRQRLEYEKLLAIQHERQRISSEIHDDIGAGLSGVRLLSELTREKVQDRELQHEVAKIHSSITELSGKMREVIWSLNTDNDTLENLVYYLQRQAYQLFESAPVKLVVSIPNVDIPEIKLGGEVRRHLYLAVKEALHNVIKHSGATECHFSVTASHNQLSMTIKDNGRGLPPAVNGYGNGMKNMKMRMKAVGGVLNIRSEGETVIEFVLPLKVLA